ncbi:hypothetical protein NKG05_20645 [Oerskovia sp. M15]
MDLGVPLPGAVQVTSVAVLVPLLVGTVVTLVASFSPARAATRVAPLAALRPRTLRPSPRGREGAARRLDGPRRRWCGPHGPGSPPGQAGQRRDRPARGDRRGAASFVGVLVGAIFWLPKVVALVGKAVTGTGSTAKLAAANTLRNPRRTAATSTALLIGVTLVAMMSTGAISARMSMNNELDGRYPVDVSLATDSNDEFGATSPSSCRSPRSPRPTASRASRASSRSPRRRSRCPWTTGSSVPGSRRGPAAAAALLRDPATVEDWLPAP